MDTDFNEFRSRERNKAQFWEYRVDGITMLKIDLRDVSFAIRNTQLNRFEIYLKQQTTFDAPAIKIALSEKTEPLIKNFLQQLEGSSIFFGYAYEVETPKDNKEKDVKN